MSAPAIIALITARGGSKALPGKNLRLLGGKPLIVWSIEAARQSRSVARVVVSTDDEAIAEVSRAAGAEVPFLRPAEISRDDSPHIAASDHALHWLEAHGGAQPDYVLLLQPTSPFRTSADIEAAIALAREKNAVAVVSVCEAKPHPCKTYGLTAEGTLADFVPCDVPYRRRQDLPPAFHDNGAIYLNRRESLLRDRTHIPPGTVPYVMPPERSLDIDTAWDLALAELVIRHGLGGGR
jgi:CMP-N,N'-diacetyllegionaminic acid synthase